jgi:hypothetical protein
VTQFQVTFQDCGHFPESQGLPLDRGLRFCDFDVGQTQVETERLDLVIQGELS